MAKEKIVQVFGGGPSLSSGPSSVSDGVEYKDGRPKNYGGGQTISSLRDGNIMPDGSAVSYPDSYKTDGAFVKRHVQRKVSGSGDASGAGSVYTSGSLGA